MQNRIILMEDDQDDFVLLQELLHKGKNAHTFFST